MKPEEIAAYIGAAAWLPQIISWLYRYFNKSKLRIVLDQFASVGFTNYGPIFNIRMAFFVENRDIIIDGIDMIIRHQDGESRVFRWAGLGETISEITDSFGNRQIVSKDQTPIAIKISTQAFLEKMVRFQDPRYHESDAVLTQTLVEHFNFLKQKNPETFVPEVLGSKEFSAVVGNRKKTFCWKQGRYELEIQPSSQQPFKLKQAKFSFELSSLDVGMLEKNIPLIETEIGNVVSSNLSDFKAEAFNWQWQNVRMLR